MDRYVRQRTLAELGDAGQARICGQTYRVPVESGASSAFEIAVERLYLERAGATRFEVGEGEPPAFVHGHAFRYAPAREFGAGAWRALRQLQRALEERP